MPRVVKSRDEIFSRWGYCDNHDLSRLDNQSIERDRLIGIGFVLNFVKFISFTFGDKEMISVIEAIVRVICEVFVDLKLAIRQDLGFIPSGNVVLSSTYVGKILGADQLLVILCYRYQESGIGYWILSMTISGSGVTFLPSCCNGSGVTFLPSEHHEVRRSG
ncbi:hypothetical protein Tco_1459197 [Tanacetum coccineum]